MLKNIDDIKKEIIYNIEKNDLISIRKNLIHLKAIGYRSEDAYRLIADLRSGYNNCPEEDFILEILDLCSDFCSPSLQIWN